MLARLLRLQFEPQLAAANDERPFVNGHGSAAQCYITDFNGYVVVR